MNFGVDSVHCTSKKSSLEAAKMLNIHCRSKGLPPPNPEIGLDAGEPLERLDQKLVSPARLTYGLNLNTHQNLSLDTLQPAVQTPDMFGLSKLSEEYFPTKQLDNQLHNQLLMNQMFQQQGEMPVTSPFGGIHPFTSPLEEDYYNMNSLMFDLVYGSKDGSQLLSDQA